MTVDENLVLIRAIYNAAVKADAVNELMARVLDLDEYVPPAPSTPVRQLRVVASNPQTSKTASMDSVSQPALRIVSRRPAKRITLQLPVSGSQVA
jgi:hypothetical protein